MGVVAVVRLAGAQAEQVHRIDQPLSRYGRERGDAVGVGQDASVLTASILTVLSAVNRGV
ncbi:hypothetical protein [Streptomyces sp900116325]|uniref:hypothetical protein n=1 Tax=unclassified Streptomyces TaxID=2593676 RepID=UPI0033AA21BA